MDFIRMPEGRKATLWDRLTNAYYAFHMKVNPDIQHVIDEIEKMQEAEQQEKTTLEEKRTAALDKLDPFTQSQIHSIASATEHWRELYEQAALFIEPLPVEDQIVIMQYMFRGNRRIAASLRFQQWMTNHAEAILDYLPE